MLGGMRLKGVSSLRDPGTYSVLGTEFLCVLLCSRVCGVWAPGQPGIWSIHLSTTELGQAARGLRACVPMTPTVSSDVVTPCPRTYLFHTIPSLPGAWRHYKHRTHGGGVEV